MRRFAEIVIKYRVLIIIGAIIMTGFFAIGMARLEVNSDILSYLDPDDPAARMFNQIGEKYSGNSIVMVGVESDDVFSLPALRLVRDLTEAYRDVDGVASVMSLTNILDIREMEGGLEVTKLVDEHQLPETHEELRQLREYTLSKEMYRGRFVSADGKITLIISRIQYGVNREGVARKIRAITEPKRNSVEVPEIYYSGVPIQIVEMQDYILQDIVKLVPIVIVVVILVLFFSFRVVRGVVLPLVAVLLSTICALGLMGWMKIPLSLISNIIPVILIAVGSAYGIHLISKYNEEAGMYGDKVETIRQTLGDVGIPILLAGVTTLIGFLSFIGAYLTAITEFGVFTAAGIGFAMLITVTLIPAMLSFLKVKREKRREPTRGNPLFIRTMDGLARFILKRAKPIVIIALVISLAALIGFPRIKRDVEMIEYFPEGSALQQTEDMMKAKFGGSMSIQIVVKGNMKDPFVLKEMRRMQKFLDSLSYVSASQSVADLICEMNDVMNGHSTIPETKDGVANLWFFIEGEEILDQLISEEYDEGLIQAQLATTDTETIAPIIDRINQYISQMNKDLKVVQVSSLNSSERSKLKKWLYDSITDTVYYDAVSRSPEIEANISPEIKLDKTDLRASIQSALEADEVKLSEEVVRGFRNELAGYFKMESVVVLTSEEMIESIVDSVVDAAASGKRKKSDYLTVLKRTVPREIQDEDTEALEFTAETLAVKVREVRHMARTQIAIDRILPLFEKELREKPDFRDDLCENLWSVNERFLGTPAGLIAGPASGVARLSAQQAGIHMVIQSLDRSLLKSQIQSFALALALVFVILSIQFRSIKAGLVTASPITLTTLINFGVMAYFGISLDIATMLVASIAIGIGIDYTIHFTSRYKLEISRNPDTLQALARTLETTGKAIIINAFTVALGFLVLLMSQIRPLQQFGWMVALTMLVSSLAALTYLPAIILVSEVKDRVSDEEGAEATVLPITDTDSQD